MGKEDDPESDRKHSYFFYWKPLGDQSRYAPWNQVKVVRTFPGYKY